MDCLTAKLMIISKCTKTKFLSLSFNIRYLCGGDCLYNNYVNNGNIFVQETTYCTLLHYICSLAIDLVYTIKEQNPVALQNIKQFARIKDAIG